MSTMNRAGSLRHKLFTRRKRIFRSEADIAQGRRRVPRSVVVATGSLLVATGVGSTGPAGEASASSSPASAAAGVTYVAAATTGLERLVTASGSVTRTYIWYGDASGLALVAPIVGIGNTPDGNGFWLVGSDGGVFSYGDAPFRGSASKLGLRAPIVGLVPSPVGSGYWLVGSDGGVFAYGSAAFLGSAASLKLAAPIVGMAATRDGKGYWLVGADGGVFSYGSARFRGSLAGVRLGSPIAAIAPLPSGAGYLLVERDGTLHGLGVATPAGGNCGGGAVIAATADSPTFYTIWTSSGRVCVWGVEPAGGGSTAAGAAGR